MSDAVDGRSAARSHPPWTAARPRHRVFDANALSSRDSRRATRQHPTMCAIRCGASSCADPGSRPQRN
eukprot:7108623-Prymnesium_polylepis.1